ncbi:phosphonate ABC transporter, permease protein PhnE [Novosphingobium sp. PS1R-30]|uniref:Phosphonate ABC transporter, permease protein PhnE n=1 Tax=Novosphingobium anseongense TaxID=3133436 RepID=A0ABU8RYB6_9SPHN
MSTATAFPRSWSLRRIAVLAVVLVLLAVSAVRVDVPRLFTQAGASRALAGMAAQMWPLQISDRQDVAEIPGFDPAHLPLFAYLQTTDETTRELDRDRLAPATVRHRKVWLVQPFGYVTQVASKLLETIEIAIWGTLIAVLLGLPLGLAGSASLVRSPTVRQAARAASAGLRAVPELLSALVLVTAFGFGPPAGILALGLHAAGFLGRFYADAIEDANQAPVRALQASGAGRLATFRFALWPQVRAPFVSSTFYILDRNVRMATVVGLVGAGGIGQELKGRIDMYEYAHVGTILVGILIVVLLLDHIAARLRRKKT